jgi:hypothetical protein
MPPKATDTMKIGHRQQINADVTIKPDLADEQGALASGTSWIFTPALDNMHSPERDFRREWVSLFPRASKTTRRLRPA